MSAFPQAPTFGPSDREGCKLSETGSGQSKKNDSCIVIRRRIVAYRARQHGSADRAYNEVRVFHFHAWLLGHYVRTFPADFAVSPHIRRTTRR
jgi:hypothetical protein